MPTDLQLKLQTAHPNFAYELLQLQIAVEDQKVTCEPEMNKITKLLQLYMTGVQVLESVSDERFQYFSNKIQSMMMKRHIAKKLHQSSIKQGKDVSFSTIKKQQLQVKKNEHDMNCFFNKGRFDMKMVKQILQTAEKRDEMSRNKLTKDIKKQEDKLQSRIKERKMRSQNGSVHKLKFSEEKSVQKKYPSQKHLKDSRMEYFDEQPVSKLYRQGSTDRIIDRKYGKVNINSNGRRQMREGV